MFSQSQILQDLPKQFFANLVAKVNASRLKGMMLSISDKAIRTSRPMISL